MSEEKKCRCNRWAVSLKASLEHDKFEKLYCNAIQYITPDEYEKITIKRHKEDALGTLIGRLLLRHVAQKYTGVPWKEIVFDRTEEGKPYIASPEGTTFGLNVTHQGDYVGFASSCTSKVGVDLMRLDKERNNKTADEYITSMAQSASPEELRMMRGQATEAMKMTFFYRYWCLKEAICKATGEGIKQDLSSLDFRINTSDRYKPGCFLTSTTVLEDNVPQDQWIFEESFVDVNHSAAVCKEKKLPRECVFRKDPEAKIFFSKVPFETLMENAEVLNPLADGGKQEYEKFMQKMKKTF